MRRVWNWAAPMNEAERDRIAHAINVARPDWPVASLRSLLARPELSSKPRRDAFVALAWVAAEVESVTPARVLENGPWWRAAAVEAPGGITRYPPRKDQECATHAGEWAENCRICAFDATHQLAEVHELHPPGDTWRPDWRTELEAVRSTLCSHGVKFTHCKQDYPSEEPA